MLIRKKKQIKSLQVEEPFRVLWYFKAHKEEWNFFQYAIITRKNKLKEEREFLCSDICV